MLKAQLVLLNRLPPRTHELMDLAGALGEVLPDALQKLQVFAVEARYEEGPFALPAPRPVLLAALEARLAALDAAIAGMAPLQDLDPHLYAGDAYRFGMNTSA